MVPRTSYPPAVHHQTLTKQLPPSAAQTQLSAFLSKTTTSPHLHPDSLLSTTGITYSAHSGPSGGLAIHHLRRIEAGLRGENLIPDTDEELKRLNCEEDEGDGDDEKLDESIAQSERKRLKESKKRKRTAEIQDWAEDTSSQADLSGPGKELESFAQNTPVHESEWEEQGEWEAKQRPMEGEVGERDGAPLERQNLGGPPEVRDGGGGGEGRRELTDKEKKARKEAKKKRRLEEKGKGRG